MGIIFLNEKGEGFEVNKHITLHIIAIIVSPSWALRSYRE